LATFLGVLLSSTSAQAVPAFARQTGMACLSCHFQNFPALNAFGRSFRAQGYTMRGAQTLIEDGDLSLPSSLNMSLITKLRYQTLESNDGGRGEIQWPDEAAFLVGGRASESVGFLSEIALGKIDVEGTTWTDQNGNNEFDEGEEDPAGSNVIGDAPGNFLSFKAHFNVTDNFSIIPFGTDALGVGYGFELMNTGAQRSQRPIENRKGMSAAQALNLDGAATGFAFVYTANDFFVNYSHVAPTFGNVNANIFGGLGHYLRAAWMPNIGGWDTGFGAASWSGEIDTGATDDEKETTEINAWVVDAQAQGVIGENMTLGLYGSYGSTPKSDSTGALNEYNESRTDDRTAYAFAAKLGLGDWRPYIAYASLDENDDETAQTTLGFQYVLAQNINFEAYYVDSDEKDADYSMLELFAGF
jgi:hypothetical protein